ncbi:MAG: hypothetical protein ACRDPC_17360 [Solirubrobacteraceae bacterium]
MLEANANEVALPKLREQLAQRSLVSTVEAACWSPGLNASRRPAAEERA